MITSTRSTTPLTSRRLTPKMLGRTLRDTPLLEWSPIVGTYLPSKIANDRAPEEFGRGPVTYGGDWTHRGDPLEQREADRREAWRWAAYDRAGLYDAVSPDYGSPGYARDRQAVVEIVQCWNGIGSPALSAPPIAKTWHWTGNSTIATSTYDPRFGYTETVPTTGPVTALADQGNRGFNAANASSTLTRTVGWCGVLDALHGTGVSTGRLICGGATSDWRLHYGDWVVILAGQFSSTAASSCLVANRSNQGFASLGMSFGVTDPDTYRYRICDGVTAAVSSTPIWPTTYTGAFVWGYRTTTTQRRSWERSRGPWRSVTGTYAVPPVDANSSGVLNIGACVGASVPLNGYFGLGIFAKTNDDNFMISAADHVGRLMRL